MSIIRSYAEVLQPRFFIEADGALAEDLIPFISRFEYEEEDNKQDQLQITVVNPGLRFMNDPRFLEGVRFRVRFGYLSDLSEMKNVVIAKARPVYDSQPKIVMAAWGLQKDMNKKANPKNWGAISSSDVAKQIAQRYGFKLEIEESKDARRQQRLQPAGVTDIQYLQQLANKLNWDAYIDGITLHFHPKRFDSPAQLEFTYYTDGTGTLVSFEPDMNLNKPPKTGVAGADTKKGESAHGGGAEGTASKPLRKGATNTGVLFSTDNNKDSGLVRGVAGPHAYNGESGVIAPSHESDRKIVQLHGKAHAQKIDMNALKANAEVIGSPRLKARTMIRISGIDKIFVGNWRVAKAKHVIDGKGYKTSIGLKRDTAKAASKSQNKNNSKEGGGDGGDHGKRVLVSGLTAIGKIFGFSP